MIDRTELGRGSKGLGRLALVVVVTLGFAVVASADEPTPSFWDRIHPTLDLRPRYENDLDRINGANDRHRARLRIRLGATVDVIEGVVAGLRIRTGDKDNPRNANAELGSDFSSLEVALDRGFVEWSPSFAPGLKITGGKEPKGFKTTPLYGELVWDADLNPEGLRILYRRSIDGTTTIGLVGGAYVESQADNDSKTAYLISGQAWIEARPTETFRLTAALGFDGYGNLVSGGSGTTTPGPPASATNPGSPKILHPIVHMTWSGIPAPITFSAEYFQDLDRFDRNDKGWAAGAAIDIPLFERRHRVYYQYQSIDESANYVENGNNDFPQSDNFRGHIFGIRWRIAQQVNIHTWMFLTQSRATGVTDTYEKRVRFDVNIAL